MRELLLMLVATSCGVGAIEDLDHAMLERVARYTEMDPINIRPHTSELGEFQIDCYASGDVESYRRIHPETTGSNAHVEPGTLIVRAVLGVDGRPATLTVMGKGPRGFDPQLGDWWFAVTDPRGDPLEEAGELQVGRLVKCHECHRDRSRDDFLFGLPASAKPAVSGVTQPTDLSTGGRNTGGLPSSPRS